MKSGISTNYRHFWLAPVVCILAACGSHTPGQSQPSAATSPAAAQNAGPPPFDSPNCANAPSESSASSRSGPDVRGVRVGMRLDDAVTLLECLDTTKRVAKETGTDTIGTYYYGHDVRTVTSIAVGPPRSADELARGQPYYTTEPGMAAGTIFSWGLAHVDASFRVLAFGEPGAETVYGVEQEQNFDLGDAPPIQSILTELIAKYGAPSVQEDQGAWYQLVWMRDSSGQAIGRGNPLYGTCPIEGTVIGARWTDGCGVTVSASISRQNQNRLLADSLRVGLVDQGPLVQTVMRLSNEWKLQDQKAKQDAAMNAAKKAPPKL